jgi:NADPH:quinone reductase-like Zn-dependent oxidoreductase
VEVRQVASEHKVLFHGAAGSVGNACVELARHLGTTITVTCREIDRNYV